jgi:hypothetical protein
MPGRGDSIKPGYLSKKGGQWIPVRLLDMAVLLYSVHLAARDELIGHTDARESLHSLSMKLGSQIFLEPNVLESALYSANLLDEQGKFVHPAGLTFEQMVTKILKGRKFDRRFSMIEGNKK